MAKTTIAISIDPETGIIGMEAMDLTLKELPELVGIPVTKLTLVVEYPDRDEEDLRRMKGKIGRALAYVPSVVEMNVKTVTEHGITRYKRDVRPMDPYLDAPETEGGSTSDDEEDDDERETKLAEQQQQARQGILNFADLHSVDSVTFTAGGRSVRLTKEAAANAAAELMHNKLND